MVGSAIRISRSPSTPERFTADRCGLQAEGCPRRVFPRGLRTRRRLAHQRGNRIAPGPPLYWRLHRGGRLTLQIPGTDLATPASRAVLRVTPAAGSWSCLLRCHGGRHADDGSVRGRSRRASDDNSWEMHLVGLPDISMHQRTFQVRSLRKSSGSVPSRTNETTTDGEKIPSRLTQT